MTERHARQIQTTVGDLINAYYEAALAEVGDKATAQRIAAALVSQMIARGRAG
jgi:hypothetical protein